MTDRSRQLLFLATVFIALVGFGVLYRLLNLPTAPELQALAQSLVDTYGFAVFLVAALLEALLIVGIYVPATLVLFVGFSITAASWSQSVLAGTVVWTGLCLAAIANYTVGRFGWYGVLVKAGFRQQISHHTSRFSEVGGKWILLSYYHPNVGAFGATAAGVLKYPLHRFIALASLGALIWTAGFGLLAALFPSIALVLLDMRILIAFAACVVVMRVVRLLRRDRTN